MNSAEKLARLAEQKRRLAERIKREKLAAKTEQRERFFRLAEQAGILQIRDAVLLEAFQKIAAENCGPDERGAQK